jgi:hypothetical protein
MAPVSSPAAGQRSIRKNNCGHERLPSFGCRTMLFLLSSISTGPFAALAPNATAAHSRTPLERILQKLTDFCDKIALQILDFDGFPFARRIPCERKAR